MGGGSGTNQGYACNGRGIASGNGEGFAVSQRCGSGRNYRTRAIEQIGWAVDLVTDLRRRTIVGTGGDDATIWKQDSGGVIGALHRLRGHDGPRSGGRIV